MDFTSKDILFIVLAFCALWFTLFVCWALWYVIRMLKDASSVMREIHEKIEAIERAVNVVREKVQATLGSFGVVAAGMRMMGDYLSKRKEKAMIRAEKVAEKIKKKAVKVKRRIEQELEPDTD